MPVAFTFNPGHDAHRADGHVERPERLDAVLAGLRADDVWSRLHVIEAAPASLDDARLVHDPAYLDRLAAAVEAGGAWLDPDTYTTPGSLDVARASLGGVLAVTDAVLDGAARCGFAAVRPPGHHATPAHQMGFCLFSNVAIAARRAQQRYGARRLLVVDFDVHHGNGTQDVFYADPDVLFMSLQQWPLWPGTGAATERGVGDGTGATVNVPLPPGTGDAGYLAAFRRILTPLALRHRPELIFVSAGYDAHWRDPLAAMRLTTHGFAALVREIAGWADACCGGRVVAALEGGYDTGALAAGVRATVRVLDDAAATIDDPIGPPAGADTDATPHLDRLAGLFGLDS